MAAVRSEILHLKKKLESDVNDEKILQIFKKLKNIPMTVDLLLSTGIGKTIRSFRKKPGEIGKYCKEIILLWKDLVISSTDNSSAEIPEPSNVQRNSNSTRTLTVERENSYTVYDDGKDVKGSSSKLCSDNFISSKQSSSTREHHCKNSSSNSDSKKRKHVENDHSVEVKRFHSSKHHENKTYVGNNSNSGEKVSDTDKNKTKTSKLKMEKSTVTKGNPKTSTKKHHSSDKKKAKVIQQKLLSQNDSDGFTSSIASFEDCLSLSDVKKKVKKKVNTTSSQNHPPNKGKSASSPKRSVESYAPNLSISSGFKPEDVEDYKTKRPDLNLNSTLPTTQPTYKPMRYAILDSPPRKKKSGLQEIDTSVFMSSKHNRTQVFSGRKTHCLTEVPSLYEMCIRVLQDNIDSIEYTGGVPYDRLKPILIRCTPQQLYQIEDYNSYLIEDTEELWKTHCQYEFKGKIPDECETWREFYLKMFDEREAKLKSITANISASMAKAVPVRQTKLAYVDTVAKPPRNVARQQAKYGTGLHAVHQEKSKSPLKMKEGMVRVPPPPAEPIPPKVIKKVPPLMQKTLKLMKSSFRR